MEDLRHTSGRNGAGLPTLLLGVVLGVTIFYITSLASMFWLQMRNAPEQQVFITLAIVSIAGASTLLARRWPRIGLVAGSVIIILVVLAYITGSAYPLLEVPWEDWRKVLGHGAGSTLVPVIGTVLVCSSVARGHRDVLMPGPSIEGHEAHSNKPADTREM